MFAQEAIVEMTAGEMREWAAWSGSLLFQRRNAPPRHRAPLATVLTDRTDWRRSNPAFSGWRLGCLPVPAAIVSSAR